jgi:hypothetical protein
MPVVEVKSVSEYLITLCFSDFYSISMLPVYAHHQVVELVTKLALRTGGLEFSRWQQVLFRRF